MTHVSSVCNVKTQVAVLKEKVFTLVQPKRLYGEVMNGASTHPHPPLVGWLFACGGKTNGTRGRTHTVLLTLARNYVEAINSGTVPTIRTAWENVVEIQCQKALQEACRTYELRYV